MTTWYYKKQALPLWPIKIISLLSCPCIAPTFDITALSELIAGVSQVRYSSDEFNIHLKTQHTKTINAEILVQIQFQLMSPCSNAFSTAIPRELTLNFRRI